jgi:hypothetical protein
MQTSDSFLIDYTYYETKEKKLIDSGIRTLENTNEYNRAKTIKTDLISLIKQIEIEKKNIKYSDKPIIKLLNQRLASLKKIEYKSLYYDE